MNSFNSGRLFVPNFDEEIWNIEILYDEGRKLTLSNTTLRLEPKSFSDFNLSSLLTQINDFLINEDEETKLIPYFFELSLFDPADHEGKQFYTLLCSQDKGGIKLYEEQMRSNILGREKFVLNNEKRGVIIPNSNLYGYPFYYSRFDNSLFKFQYQKSNEHIYIGQFLDPLSNLPSDSIEELKVHIENFFNSVLSSFSASEKKSKGKPLNTALLIPIFRPASLLSNLSKGILKGGGLFIFGYSNPKTFNVYKFVVKARNLISKSVTQAGFHQLELEKIRERQRTIELNLYHHLGSNLKALPDMLNIENFNEKGNLTTRQQMILSQASERISATIDNVRHSLKAYRNYIVKQDNNKKHTVLSLITGLNDLIVKYNEDKPIRIKFEFEVIEPIDYTCDIYSLTQDLLASLVDSFIVNMIDEIQKNKGKAFDNPTIKVSLSVFQYVGTKILDIKIHNNYTHLDEKKLYEIGIAPIKSQSSSGLGFYFLNHILELVGAEQSDNMRYFKISNCSNPNGVEVNFSFKLIE